jgi:hypothetical protein
MFKLGCKNTKKAALRHMFLRKSLSVPIIYNVHQAKRWFLGLFLLFFLRKKIFYYSQVTKYFRTFAPSFQITLK